MNARSNAVRPEDMSDPAEVRALPKLLAVDDEPLVLRMLRRIFSPDCEVHVESSAEAALERIARGETFDLILCDLQMPQMSGVDFHREVAWRRPQLSERIVFLSGGAFSPDVAEYVDALPRWRLVTKPFELERLRALVDEFGGRV